VKGLSNSYSQYFFNKKNPLKTLKILKNIKKPSFIKNSKKMVSIQQREEFDDSSIHCISFNYFGTRLAMCSADGNIQVWDLFDSKWKMSCKWPSGHSGAIFKVRWAHPEYGSLLATCSFDKTVIIFEENPLDQSWKKLSQLVEGHEPVEDIQFAPPNRRLQLAVCSSNGEIRIYEPASPINLKLWNSPHFFVASRLGSNVLAWNASLGQNLMLLIGNNDLSKASEKFSRTFEEPVETLQLWSPTEDGKQWEKIFVPENSHEKAVVDISWAQLMGRNKHVVASCDLEGSVIIWRIDSRGTMEIEENLRHGGKVYNIAWDLMGTTLSCVGEDSLLKIWKKNLQGKWQKVQDIKN
jgi:WD40 repeat protein